MNITSGNFNQRINFGSRYDKYFDTPVELSRHQIIPEYEDVDLDVRRDDEPKFDLLREDELFDRNRDYVTPEYSIYDYDDVKLADNIIYRDFIPDSLNISDYFETQDRKDSFGFRFNNFTVENAWKKEHESFQERLEQGYKREDIASVYHSALIRTGDDKKKMDLNMAKKGFELLDKGKSISEVSDLMDKSKLSYGDGSTRFSPQLLDFLSEYPDSRSVVVSHRGCYEYIRPDVMGVFHQVKEVCDKEEDVMKVIRACEAYDGDKKVVVPHLTSTCLESIKDGFPVETVTKNLKQSLLPSWDRGKPVFDRELYDFLFKYPSSKEDVVNKTSRNQYFDRDLAENYVTIANVCDNEQDVPKILDTCKIGSTNNRVVNKRLLSLAEKLLEKDSEWTSEHDLIMNSLVSKSGQSKKSIKENKFELANTMADGEYGINAIYSALVLNVKNVELLK